jgi:hypothetical protein
MIHQRDKWRLAVGFLVRQRKIMAERAIDELCAGVGIQQHDADVDLIERGGEPLGRRMMPALPGERIHHSFSHQSGDGGEKIPPRRRPRGQR